MESPVSTGLRRFKNSPHDETQLVPLALSLVEFQVVNTPSALLFRQLLDKRLEIGRSGFIQLDLLQCGNGLHAFAHTVHDELVLFAELELFIGLETGFVL